MKNIALSTRFRQWLEDHVGRRRQADAAMATVDSLRARIATKAAASRETK